MEILEIIKHISSLISYLLVIGGFIAACFRPVREKFANWIKETCHSKEAGESISKLEKKMEEIKKESDKKDKEIKDSVKELAGLMREHIAKDAEKIEEHKKLEKSDRTIIRSEITAIYYRYCKKRAIPVYEKENFIYLYDQYTKELNGNSYIADIKEQVDTWDIIYKIPED